MSKLSDFQIYAMIQQCEATAARRLAAGEPMPEYFGRIA